ncbi:MAG: restriction endonuclease subunit S [Paludibacteraceae bacterium]|nr:restriction endonuclease subunit S [Paludibacteraceae bacterium]
MKQNWEYKKLGEIGTFQRCSGIQKSDFVKNGMPCIHYGQIHTKFGVSVNHHLSEISEELFNKSKIANPGDIVLAITSEDVEGSCKCIAWLGDYDVAVGAHAAIFKHHENPKYISYSFRSADFYIQKAKYARGFKVKEIKPSEVALITIPVPPLSTQTAIVSELDTLSAIIADHKSLLKKYDELEQSIFYDMFGDPVKNEKGWEVKKLGEVCEVNPSKKNAIQDMGAKEEVSFLPMEDLPINALYYSPNQVRDLSQVTSSYTYFQNNDVLMAKVTPCFENGKRGIAINLKNNLGFGSSEFHVIREGKLLKKEYIYYLTFDRTFISMAVKNLTGTSGLRRVPKSFLENFKVPLPPLPLQQEFASKIEAIEAMKADTKKSLEKAEELFNARMDYYFNA